MKKITPQILLLAAISCLLVSGCQSSAAPAEDRDALFQYSLLGSLLAGVYDGQMTMLQLSEHGDFGLGTFNTLDGEMVVLNGRVYQVRSDGTAYPAENSQQTPFAAVTFFEVDQTLNLPSPLTCEELKQQIDSVLSSENLPYAVKVTGSFTTMNTRSVPPQQKPYQPLTEVLETQPTFDLQDVVGTMAGFRLPGYMDVINAPGYHFHFINREMTAGGHVLDCLAEQVTVEIDQTGDWEVVLPEDEAFKEVNLSTEEYQ
jgi:acetolactate decarboxylase